MERQVVVRLPANGDSAAVLAAAKAAVVAAAECDPTCIDGTHVLYKGKAAQASGQAAQAAGPRARQAVVMVYMRHAATAAAAVRHSARLASMDQFKGVYINEALTADQRRVRAAFWRGSPELHATRELKGAIRWRHGVPHMRVQGEGGRVEWRAMALPQGKGWCMHLAGMLVVGIMWISWMWDCTHPSHVTTCEQGSCRTHVRTQYDVALKGIGSRTDSMWYQCNKKKQLMNSPEQPAFLHDAFIVVTLA